MILSIWSELSLLKEIPNITGYSSEIHQGQSTRDIWNDIYWQETGAMDLPCKS
jgi:hypothetical protein